MNTRQKLQIVVSAIIFLMFISGMIAVTFFLTALFYHSIGYQPPAFLVQVINSLIGLFLGWLMLVGFFVIPGVRRNRMGVFQPIIEALERIARGDFTVRLDHPIRNNALISELANSVNHMALELNQMEQMRQAFISDVSHEIQSPLTSIRGFAQALHSDQLSATDRDHYLSIIEAESTRLSNLTDNLLKLASLESEQPPFQPRSYRLDKQIRRLILLCEPQWMSKAIDMDVSLEEITITADEDLLSQVWLNLLHNSIKFTPNGGSVCISQCRQDGGIVLTIADTGIGISTEDQVHVFERFYKADKSRERTHEGSGLGLAIAKKIIEMHHGTISLTSEAGVGTTFTISLPIEQAGNDAEKARVSA
jgi:two-component system, OmpR family, phosphate regulon sensor histidine kinase PhoR